MNRTLGNIHILRRDRLNQGFRWIYRIFGIFTNVDCYWRPVTRFRLKRRCWTRSRALLTVRTTFEQHNLSFESGARTEPRLNNSSSRYFFTRSSLGSAAFPVTYPGLRPQPHNSPVPPKGKHAVWTLRLLFVFFSVAERFQHLSVSWKRAAACWNWRIPRIWSMGSECNIMSDISPILGEWTLKYPSAERLT